MAKVIIGIHGMGNKPSRKILENWWKNAMQEGLDRIESGIELPKFELVYWADILNGQLLDENIKDINSPLFINEPFASSLPEFKIEEHPLKKKVLDFIEGNLDKYFLNDDLTINYSFLSDAIIKKYFKEVYVYFNQDCEDENGRWYQARNLIKSRFYEVIRKYPNDELMVVAHSMGSIIAYDVLTFVQPELKVHSFITMGSPLGLPFIIGKIAQGGNFKLTGKKKLVTPPGVYGQWLNFADPSDRIALDQTLSDDYESNDLEVRARDFSIINDYVFQGMRNPHKSFGYLRAPEFSNVLRDFIGTGNEPTINIRKSWWKRFLIWLFDILRIN